MLVVKPDDTIEVRPVTTAERIGSAWVIEHGLAAGERVVVEGLQKARAGAKVVAKNFAQAASDPPPPTATNPGGK